MVQTIQITEASGEVRTIKGETADADLLDNGVLRVTRFDKGTAPIVLSYAPGQWLKVESSAIV